MSALGIELSVGQDQTNHTCLLCHIDDRTKHRRSVGKLPHTARRVNADADLTRGDDQEVTHLLVQRRIERELVRLPSARRDGRRCGRLPVFHAVAAPGNRNDLGMMQ